MKPCACINYKPFTIYLMWQTWWILNASPIYTPECQLINDHWLPRLIFILLNTISRIKNYTLAKTQRQYSLFVTIIWIWSSSWYYHACIYVRKYSTLNFRFLYPFTIAHSLFDVISSFHLEYIMTIYQIDNLWFRLVRTTDQSEHLSIQCLGSLPLEGHGPWCLASLIRPSPMGSSVYLRLIDLLKLS